MIGGRKDRRGGGRGAEPVSGDAPRRPTAGPSGCAHLAIRPPSRRGEWLEIVHFGFVGLAPRKVEASAPNLFPPSARAAQGGPGFPPRTAPPPRCRGAILSLRCQVEAGSRAVTTSRAPSPLLLASPMVAVAPAPNGVERRVEQCQVPGPGWLQVNHGAGRKGLGATRDSAPEDSLASHLGTNPGSEPEPCVVGEAGPKGLDRGLGAWARWLVHERPAGILPLADRSARGGFSLPAGSSRRFSWWAGNRDRRQILAARWAYFRSTARVVMVRSRVSTRRV